MPSSSPSRAGAPAPEPPRLHRLGERDYEATWAAMRALTDRRGPQTPDEIWLVRHPPVYTLGQAGRMAHVLDPGDTPVIRTDRGGQVTWHGPGQAIAYPLVDLRRRGMGIRDLVTALEEAVIRLLADYGVAAERRTDAPGVYVGSAKVAALGVRVRRGCSYHGLALNVCNDLAPFSRINPCGFQGMATTRLQDLGVAATLEAVETALGAQLQATLQGHPHGRADAAPAPPPRI